MTISFFRKHAAGRALAACSLIPGLLTLSVPAYANPTGGVVVHGDVSMSGGAGLLTINQGSQNAIINWADFSIAAGETTRFVQPGSGAAVLNRVTGGNPSAIHGALEANGSVFVINPNGILVGAGGTIDVHGLVLSTLDVSNGEFLARGDMLFQGDSQAGVVNYGRINAIGGDVFLMGRTVSNYGDIAAPSGTVGLGAGSEVLLSATEGARGERMLVRAGSGGGGTGVLNDGTIEGAAVELKAHGNVYALAINNKGSVRATGVSQSGGRVFLSAPGGSVRNTGVVSAGGDPTRAARVLIEAAYARVDGQIRAEGGGELRVAATERAEVGGTLDASSAVGAGGDLIVEGREIEIGSGALLDVSGATGGGYARIGGGFQGADPEVRNAESLVVESDALLRADATVSGRGGSVVLWSDADTLFAGEIRAEGIVGGGFVEVSGKAQLGFDGIVSTRSADGSAGVLLLDPTDGRVSNSSHNPGGSPFNINASSLVAALGSSHVVLSTPSAGTDPGNFSFESAVLWDSEFSLTTLAHGDITFTASVRNAGTGDLNFVAGWDGTTGLPSGSPFDATGSFSAAAFLDNLASFGNGGHGVRIGTGSQGAAVSVGSRLGATRVLGDHLHLTGGSANNRPVQLGYRPGTGGIAGAAAGDIFVRVLDGVSLTAGQTGSGNASSPGQYNHALIGHGGRLAADLDFHHSGDIDIRAGLGGAGFAGDIVGIASPNREGYVQIGHGGSGGSTSAAFGSYAGDITVIAGENGKIEFTAGIGRRAYVQIGHGGYAATAGTDGGGTGFHQGDIRVEAGADLAFRAGAGSEVMGSDSRAYALIGHGGYLARAFSDERGHLGDIHVAAGTGGVSGGILFQAGDLADNFAQLGHGGFNSRSGVGAQGHSGAIHVESLDDLVFLAGTGRTFRGHNDERLYVQLGHGGYTAGSNNNVVSDPGTGAGHSGNISVRSIRGDIRFLGGNLEFGSAGDGLGRIHYAQLGHGGYSSHGDHHGSISVEADGGRIVFLGGNTSDTSSSDVATTDGDRNYAQLGHGGYATRGDFGRAGDTIEARAQGDIVFTGGGAASNGRNYAQIGHGGRSAADTGGGRHGDIAVVSTLGDILFTGGAANHSYALVGHGGASSGGSGNGDILVAALAGAVRFTSGNANAFAQIGHGGISASGDHSGNIAVRAAGEVAFDGVSGYSVSTDRYAYTRIGHGGGSANGTLSGDIRVSAGTVGLFDDGFAGELFSGPLLFSGAAPGEADGITFLAGPTSDRYAQIGHGGRAANGDRDGDIEVVAEGDILFVAGAGSRTYAQIGHGGRLAPSTPPAEGADPNGDNSGDIRVVSHNGGIEFRWATATASPGSGAYAQLGHGGLYAVGDHSGEIEVEARDGILFRSITHSSGRTHNYVQLGHGGAEARGSHSGGISVLSREGDVSFLSGTRGLGNRYAQLGHGGLNAGGDHSGGLRVAAGGSVILDGLNNGHEAQSSYVQIGHGGHGAAAATGHWGGIEVLAGGQVRVRALPGSTEGHAMIGHGGRESGGDHEGDITVVSGIDSSGGVTVAAGARDGAFAQIGHGGLLSSGDLSGRITVVADRGGDLSLTAGDGDGRYAMVGHGDGSGTTTGTREGGVRLFADGAITLAGGGGDSGTALWHRSEGGLAADRYLGGDGFQVLANGGLNAPDASLAGAATMVEGNLGAGPVAVALPNQIDLSLGTGAGISVDGDEDLVLLTGGNLSAQRSYQNAGSGGIALVAGWSGAGLEASVDLSSPDSPRISAGPLGFNQCGLFGQNGGSVEIGSAGQTEAVRIGSRLGTAMVAGHAVTIAAGSATSGAATQLGFFGNGESIGGAIALGVGGGGLSLLAGAASAYAQIGHGGFGSVAAPVLDAATITVSFCETDGVGDLRLVGGSAADAYAQIGHGGVRDGDDARGGAILVQGHRDLELDAGGTRAYAQIGHGGWGVEGDFSGAVTVTGSGAATLAGGGSNAYAQIGHGGRSSVGERSGAVAFAASSAVLSGGTADRSYAQIGHGGADASGMVSAADIGVEVSGGLSLLAGGGQAYAQIGHGGYNGINVRVLDSGIAVNVATGSGQGDIVLQGGTGSNASAQIGHGGARANSNTGGDMSSGGDILVGAAANVTLAGGSDADAYAQIGHGGERTQGDFSGSVTVHSADAVDLEAGTGNASFARIGHGGHLSDGDKDGAITVFAGGDVSVTGGAGSGGVDRFAQIGHGGLLSPGNASGDLTLDSLGSVALRSGNTNDAAAMVGHGGYRARGEHEGAVRVTAVGSVTGTALGSRPRTGVMIGHGGVEASTGSGRGNSGDILVGADTGDIIFIPGASTNGFDAYAQIGHGGSRNVGDHSGDIRVIAPEGSIEFRWPATSSTPGPRSYGQLGHGGNGAVGSHSGSIQALAGQGILFQSTTHSTTNRFENYVQLGHGGFNAAGNHSGDITVLADAGSVAFRFGTRGGGDRYAQLGHGGSGAVGTHSGDIAVLAGNAITFTGLSGSTAAARSYAQLGHGGLGASSPFGHSGRIAVATRVGAITFTGGGNASDRTYSQLGHGGFDAAGSHHGDILVRGGNNVLFTGGGSTGAGYGNYAQLGHGGMMDEGSAAPESELRGSITATARMAGTFDDIGDFYGADGSLGPDGNFDTIEITTGTSGTGLRLLGGSNIEAVGNYAQLGHGGLNRRGSHGGADDFIFVQARRNVIVTGGGGERAYAQLGHGGHGAASTSGGHMGRITVLAGDDNMDSASVLADGGAGEQSYAQVGHGGYGATGNHSGGLYTSANNNVRFRSTDSGNATSGQYAQLGHGGLGAAGDHEGDITVMAQRGSLQFRGGVGGGADRYAQLGHGGTNAAGTHRGDIAALAQTSITFAGRSTSTTSVRGYAQLGHGGHGAASPLGHSGRIGVGSSTGTILFQGGGDESIEAYAQLGHGGFDATGSHQGDIVVRGGNSFYFDGGTGAGLRNYAQLGHGGMISATGGGPAGNLSGSIVATSRISGVFSDLGDFFDVDGRPGQSGSFDEIALVGGTSNTGLRFRGGTDAGSEDAYSLLGHGGTNYTGDHEGDIQVQARRNIRYEAGAGDRAYVQIGHGGHGAAATTGHAGDISVVNGDENEELVDFTFLSGVGVDSYAQVGHGGTGALGSHRGDIYASSNRNMTFTATASDASASGQYVQIGHGGVGARGAHEGDISVRAGAAGATGFLGFTGGNPAASPGVGVNRYAQIGHGGFATGGGHSGDIEVFAPSRVRFRAGRLDGAYAQIGHGGLVGYSGPDGSGGGNSGDIRVGVGGGDLEVTWSTNSSSATGTPGLGSYAQLGHGGYDAEGGNEGDIVARAAGNILFRGTRGNDPANHVGSYVQLGHGGYRASGDHSGSITASAGIGGSFSDVYGFHGGGSGIALDFVSNEIGSVTFHSGSGGTDRYAQFGHGGYLARGNHGRIDGDGNALDTLSLTALGDVEFLSRGSVRNYVQFGNGGTEASPTSAPRGHAANLELRSLEGDISFLGSTSLGTYAQLGNGGWDTPGNHRGDITVEAGRDLFFTATTSVSSSGNNTYAQLGHGGRFASGDHRGDIVARAGIGGVSGDLVFEAGHGNDRTSQLGHGGQDTTGSHSGSILVESWGEVRIEGGGLRTFSNRPSRRAGEAALAGGGASGRLSFSSSTTTTGSLATHVSPGTLTLEVFNPVEPEHAEIVDDGMGNLLDLNGNVVGSIDYLNAELTFTVKVAEDGTAGGDTLRATYGEFNHSRAFAQIGHGGLSSTGSGHSGDIAVNAGLGGTGGLVLQGGLGEEGYAQLGHGGLRSTGDHGGAISVGVPDGIHVLGGGGNAERARSYAQIGHGGLQASGGRAGSIQLALGGDLEIAAAGAGFGGYAQVGHGGAGLGSSSVGGILVEAGGSASVVAGQGGDGRDARIGHGGAQQSGSASGDIALSVQGGFVLQASDGGSAQLGHGGASAAGGKSGEIEVEAASLRIEGGTAAGRTAQIGHGGRGGAGDVSGTISATARTGGIELLAGGAQDAAAQIGHGGGGYSGRVANQAIRLASAGALAVRGGDAMRSWAQIGHGGTFATGGEFSGLIDVAVGEGLLLESGAALSYAQIGHGGASVGGLIGGEVRVVVAAGDARLSARDASLGSYAKIGHGDDFRGAAAFFSGTGEREGDITVSVAESLALEGASIGHVGPESPAMALGGSTVVGVSRLDPADADLGELVADELSSFSGGNELRFYLPRRESFAVEAGAMLNGVPHPGAIDPWMPQQANEFTVNLIDPVGVATFVGEHDHGLGSGAYDPSAGRFAFYFDTIAFAAAPPALPRPANGGGGQGSEPGLPDAEVETDLRSFRISDRSEDDWQRERRADFAGFSSFEIYYEGYESYERDGEFRVRGNGEPGAAGIEMPLLLSEMGPFDPTVIGLAGDPRDEDESSGLAAVEETDEEEAEEVAATSVLVQGPATDSAAPSDRNGEEEEEE